jgi:hypothetical protein
MKNDNKKERKVVIIEGPEAALRRPPPKKELDRLIEHAKAFDQAARENILKRYNDLMQRKK